MWILGNATRSEISRPKFSILCIENLIACFRHMVCQVTRKQWQLGSGSGWIIWTRAYSHMITRRQCKMAASRFSFMITEPQATSSPELKIHQDSKYRRRVCKMHLSLFLFSCSEQNSLTNIHIEKALNRNSFAEHRERVTVRREYKVEMYYIRVRG